MRKLLLLLIIVAILIFSVLNILKAQVRRDLLQPVIYPTGTATDAKKHKITKIPKVGTVKTSLFVPYWSLGQTGITDTDYDQFIYFGLVPTTEGINTDDPGSQHLNTFTTDIPAGNDKILALRMIDSDNNSAILNSKQIEAKVITDTIQTATQNGFSGIVLDLEMSAIPFDSLVNQITDFNKQFYTEAKKNNLNYSLTLYGDSYFRPRPFNVESLAKSADSILIMAYDFHKPKANPGPNFPLNGKETYGYDMTKMVDDFSQDVSMNKITVIFGLFGYDWQVDDQGKAIDQAKALTYDQIKGKFLDNCQYAVCSVTRDKTSGETTIHYTDDKKKHIVWFEDMESVKAKEKYLKEKGISSFSFWANSYF